MAKVRELVSSIESLCAVFVTEFPASVYFSFFPAGETSQRPAAWRITKSPAVLRADAGSYRLHKLNAFAFTFDESQSRDSFRSIISAG